MKTKIDKKRQKNEKKQHAIAVSADFKPIVVSCLDLQKIGCIITAKKHDADSLRVEEADVGEAAPVTVVSELVSHVPLEQMQNHMILLCI